MRQQYIRMCLKGGLALFLLLAWCGGSFFLSQQAHAAVQATYYVSPMGSDSNSGTSINSPFATLDHARQVIESIKGATSESVTNNVTEHIGAAWLAPNPNSFDSPGNTADGNYTDDPNYGTRNLTVTNTDVDLKRRNHLLSSGQP